MSLQVNYIGKVMDEAIQEYLFVTHATQSFEIDCSPFGHYACLCYHVEFKILESFYIRKFCD